MGFSLLDYLVLGLYLVGITVFGALFRRSHKTAKDYFLGAKNTSWVVISVSIVATETSTLTFIGAPIIAYSHAAHPAAGGALTFLQVVFGYVIARFVISLLFIPAYFRGELVTAYALLDRRFGSLTKHVTASLFLMMRPLSDGVRVFATSLVLSAVLGASFPGIPDLWFWSILCVGVLTLIYTFEGGITAVIWTDLIQFVIYVAGALFAAYDLLQLVPGGWTTVVDRAASANKLQLFSFTWDFTLPYTFWAGVVGGTFLTMASHGTDQLLVQRLLTCRKERDAQKALILSGFIVLAQFALFLVIGLMLFAYYQFQPLPPITTPDELFPAFIVRNLPHGISGLVIAAILAAAMSTLSGALNSLSSTTMADFYQPMLARRAAREGRAVADGALEQARLLRLSRWWTAAWGVALIAVALVAKDWGSVLPVGLTIASIVYGPMLGAFLLGVVTTRANETGAIAGIVVSLTCMILVKIFTPLAWTWYVLVGTVICAAVGYAASLITTAPLESAARTMNRVAGHR
ncbi:MAG: sodium:solute symporter [Bacteroidales bacterium]